MPVTVNHVKSATTPDNPAYEIKPQADWNNTHLATFQAVGSEIVGAFSNSPSVSFGLSGGFVTASAVGGGGAGNLVVSAGSTSQVATGLTFSNSNGLSWGINNGTLTGSYTVPTQSNQTQGFYITGNTTLSSSGTMDARSQTVSAVGLLSIGVSNGSLIISGAAGTGSGIGASAGTQSVSNGVVTFSNSNGVSWGLNAGVLTATVNPGPAAGIGAFADGNAHTQTTGSLVFSNSNGLSFGVSTGAGAGTVTGSYTVPSTAGLISAFNVSAGTTSSNLTNVVLSNSNGVSFGLNAGTVTASVVQSTQPVAVSGSNGSSLFSTLSMGNLNGLSHYMSNGSLVASYTVPAQTNQSVGIFGLSQTTQNTSGTVDARSMTFAGAGNVSIGISNGSVVVSGATVAGLTSGGAYAAGNTTGVSSSSTYPLTNFNISGAGIISAGWSSNSLIISGPATTGITLLSVGMSTGGNTTGTTGMASNQLVLAGGANITLSGSTNAGSMTVSIVGGAGGGGGGIAAAAGTQTATSGTVVFSNSNNVSFGMSNSSVVTASYGLNLSATGGTSNVISGLTFKDSQGVSFGLSTGAGVGTITASVAAQTNQTLSFAATSNTAGNTSGMSVDARSLTVAGYGIASVGMSTSAGGSTLLVSATQSNQAFSAQGGSSAFQTLPFTNSNNFSFSNTGGSVWGSWALNVSATGGTSNALSGLTFKDSNGVSFGLSTGAGIGTLTASISQSNQNNSLFALGNTTQNSSTVLNASALSFNGLGAQTVGFSNGSIQLSVPATSSLVGTNGLSVSVNGSTLSVSNIGISRVMIPYGANLTAVTAPGNASMSLQYVPIFQPITGTRIDALIGISAGSAATSNTAALAFSAYCIIYTKNGSTLSSLSSGSTQTTYSYASNSAGNTQLTASVIRPMSVPVNFNMTQGEYYVGFNMVTNTSSIGANTTNLGATISMYGGNDMQTGLNFAEFANNTATSTNMIGGMGMYSAATTGVPTAVSLSAINATGSAVSAANIALVFRNV